jgi:hypothetical protein
MDCIEGIVIPTAWDSEGNVISLAIATSDEQEYLIGNNGQITNLLPLLRRDVVVTGSVETCKGHKVIRVAKIQAA